VKAHVPVPAPVKLGYGVGQFTEGVKTAAFNFVFFLYTQVLGVPAAPVGLVLLIATIWDAITDPLMGSISDRARFALGRRHGFMYAAAVPLGLSYVAMFMPPAGATGAWLWIWLGTTAIAARTAMTMFHVPYLALGAELSRSYTERTTIVGVRTAFSLGGLAVMLAIGWGWFFRATPEFANGQLNPAAYPGFAVMCGGLAALTALIAGASTHARIPHLPRATGTAAPLSMRSLWQDWRVALANSSFRALVIGLVAFGTMRGVQETLSIHLYTYFWRLSSSQILAVYLAGIGALLASIPAWTAAATRIDKKPVLLIGAVVFTAAVVLMPVLRSLAAFPGDDSEWLMPALLVGYGIAGLGAAAVFVSTGSMLADVADELEATSGQRMAGVLFGASALSFKVTSGLGGFLGGLALSAIQFPVGAAPDTVSVSAVTWLGWSYGPLAGVFGFVAAWSFTRYALTRDRHARLGA
jgi:Na+/melibiose symporter-like transporter